MYAMDIDTTYFARVVSHTHKMFIALTTFKSICL
jgi:hypothetical protein